MGRTFDEVVVILKARKHDHLSHCFLPGRLHTLLPQAPLPLSPLPTLSGAAVSYRVATILGERAALQVEFDPVRSLCFLLFVLAGQRTRGLGKMSTSCLRAIVWPPVSSLCPEGQMKDFPASANCHLAPL